jgi:hypothetical protein
MPRACLRPVWPEEQVELVTTPPPFASSRKYSEQGEPAALVSVLAEDRVVSRASERERPECPKTIATGRVRLRGRFSQEANLGHAQRDSKKWNV